MKIATWNVNSVRARLDSIAEWIKQDAPDVILLQEIKCQEEAFPYAFFEDFGYFCAVFGQKSYNGVAVLSRLSVEDITRGLPTFPQDSTARYIECVVGGTVRVASVYVPNGGPIVGAEAYVYKLEFLDRFAEHLAKISSYGEDLFVGGDYNIAPSDDDVYDAKIWHERVCCTSEERARFRSLLSPGLRDALGNFARAQGNSMPFTWWDYRSRASFAQNRGLRLDHILVSSSAAERIQSMGVCTHCRTMPRPSDHAPVHCVLSD